jgi:RimJ/RimL family protein N-acetyltransferase
MIIAETGRLLIRPFDEADAPFVLHLLNTPGWIRFIGDRGIATPEDARKYIVEKLLNSYTTSGWGMYLVESKAGNVPVGMCGLVKRDSLQHADLGYAFLPEYNGKGYALEAAVAIMWFANKILQLNPVLAIVTPDNERSISLLQKLHFVFDKNITDNGEELLLYKHEADVLKPESKPL